MQLCMLNAIEIELTCNSSRDSLSIEERCNTVDATTEEINSAIEEIVNIPENPRKKQVKSHARSSTTEEAPQQETESEEQVELEADSDLLDHLDAVEDEAEEEINEAL